MTDSIFAPQAPCGIFAPTTMTCGEGLWQSLTFLRPAHLVQGRAPTQSLAGEVVLSFVPVTTALMNVQPQPRGFSRFLFGQLVEVNATAIGFGNLDIQEGDRCLLSGMQVEVIGAEHWGTISTDLDLKYLGR